MTFNGMGDYDVLTVNNTSVYAGELRMTSTDLLGEADGRARTATRRPRTPRQASPELADLAARRNELVAALADQVFVAYATPGGRLETSLRQNPLPLMTP